MSAAEKFTDRVDLRTGREVWSAFKAVDAHGYDIVRIEFVDGTALEVRADGHCASLTVSNC